MNVVGKVMIIKPIEVVNDASVDCKAGMCMFLLKHVACCLCV